MQHERGPRNTTLRRQQMAHFFQDPRILTPSPSALGLTIPNRVNTNSETIEGVPTISPRPPVLCGTPSIFPRVR